MTHYVCDSPEISTCVLLSFYVTPPYSQALNMMHICTSTATPPLPHTHTHTHTLHSTPTSANHKNRRTEGRNRVFSSPITLHMHTLIYPAFSNMCMHVRGIACLKNLNFRLYIVVMGVWAYVLPSTPPLPPSHSTHNLSSPHISYHANEMECQPSVADGQRW